MQTLHCEEVLLGGSGVVISRVITPVIWVISIVNLLITLLITTHEPPSRSGPGRGSYTGVGSRSMPPWSLL